MPSIELTRTIDPATEKWIGAALDDAADDGAPLAIIRLDTPAGSTPRCGRSSRTSSPRRCRSSSTSRRTAPGPPRPAPSSPRRPTSRRWRRRPTSARRAPSTRPAATSTRRSAAKIENDAAAFIRALAEAHGRNGDARRADGHRGRQRHRRRGARRGADRPRRGERGGAARRSSTASGSQGPKAQTLDTAGLEIDERDMPLQYEVAAAARQPDVAFLLLLVGPGRDRDRALQPGADPPGSARRRLVPARRLRHRAAAGDRGRHRCCWWSGSA